MRANREAYLRILLYSLVFIIILEDYGTTQFLMKELKTTCPGADTRFISFYDMKIDDEGIPLEDGSHAALLYRLHPYGTFD